MMGVTVAVATGKAVATGRAVAVGKAVAVGDGNGDASEIGAGGAGVSGPTLVSEAKKLTALTFECAFSERIGGAKYRPGKLGATM
jgi:hypothetical protein